MLSPDNPIQPPTEVWQVCWGSCEVCVLMCDGRVPVPAHSLHLYSRWFWCSDNHVWVISGVNLSIEFSQLVVYLLGFFMMSLDAWVAGYSSYRLRSASWCRAAGNIRDAEPSYTDLARERGCKRQGMPSCDTQIAARSLWEDEGH